MKAETQTTKVHLTPKYNTHLNIIKAKKRYVVRDRTIFRLKYGILPTSLNKNYNTAVIG